MDSPRNFLKVYHALLIVLVIRFTFQAGFPNQFLESTAEVIPEMEPVSVPEPPPPMAIPVLRSIPVPQPRLSQPSPYRFQRMIAPRPMFVAASPTSLHIPVAASPSTIPAYQTSSQAPCVPGPSKEPAPFLLQPDSVPKSTKYYRKKHGVSKTRKKANTCAKCGMDFTQSDKKLKHKRGPDRKLVCPVPPDQQPGQS